MNIFKTLQAWILARLPKPDVFDGAGIGLKISAWILITVAVIGTATEAFSIYAATGLFVAVAVVLLMTAAIFLAYAFINSAQRTFLRGLTWFAVVSFFLIGGGMGFASLVAIIPLALGACCVGGGWAAFKRRGGDWRSWSSLVCGVLLLGVWVGAYSIERWPTQAVHNYPASDLPQLSYPDPSQPGPWDYTVITYGSGDNPQRPEFGDAVDVQTAPVDGSKLVDGWEGRGAWARTHYWDVTADRLPLNGTAWVPQGAGPFPIVLIVHGNHAMEDFSDTGYAYLGELFASHRLLTVSVDQNFLNSSFGDLLGIPDVGLDEENDARGWLLLQHLALFRRWNQTPDHPLAGKGDPDRVVLIGHSRGGEAVSEAAVFNHLSAYPDNALLSFDFNFGIQGVIAIAPVDGQYHPRDDFTWIRDTNYLVIHGSHDGDVTSYSGYSTYSRTRFQDCADCFKAGYYLLGANHGQFNTSWGDTDAPFTFARWLNRQHLIPGPDQRRVAKALFMAFMRTTLFGDDRYLDFLATPERAKSYLPASTVLLNQFQSARETTIANFMEDDEVNTLTMSGAHASGTRLSLWREQHMKMKWQKTGTAAVILGWQSAEDDPDQDDPAQDDSKQHPRYTMQWPDMQLTQGAQILLSLAALPEPPGEMDDYTPPDTVDFSLKITDAAGQSARIRLSDYKPLGKQVDPQVLKLHSLHSERTEVVFNRYAFPIDAWVADNQQIDHNALVSLTLVFDQTSAATIALERVALSESNSTTPVSP